MILLIVDSKKWYTRTYSQNRNDTQILKANLQLPNGTSEGKDNLGGWD